MTPTGAPPARSRRSRLTGRTLAIAIALQLLLPGYAAAAVSFSTAPNAPNLPAVTLNGQATTDNATMANWGVTMSGSKTGWNVTVAGDTTAGKSAVFKQYCSNGASACGSDPANSYVSGGRTLAAGSRGTGCD